MPLRLNFSSWTVESINVGRYGYLGRVTQHLEYLFKRTSSHFVGDHKVISKPNKSKQMIKSLQFNLILFHIISFSDNDLCHPPTADINVYFEQHFLLFSRFRAFRTPSTKHLPWRTMIDETALLFHQWMVFSCMNLFQNEVQNWVIIIGMLRKLLPVLLELPQMWVNMLLIFFAQRMWVRECRSDMRNIVLLSQIKHNNLHQENIKYNFLKIALLCCFSTQHITFQRADRFAIWLNFAYSFRTQNSLIHSNCFQYWTELKFACL